MYFQTADSIETLSRVLQHFNRAIRSIKDFYFEIHPEQDLSFKDRVLLDFEEFLVVKQQTNQEYFDTFLESTKEVYQFILGTSYIKIHKNANGAGAVLYVYNTPLVQIITLPPRLNRLFRCSSEFKNFFVSCALAQNFIQCDDEQMIKNALTYCLDHTQMPFKQTNLAAIRKHPLMQIPQLNPTASFTSINQLDVIFINPKEGIKFEEVLIQHKIQQYSTTQIVTFSSLPQFQYSVWFLATPFPVIVTDILSGHDYLAATIDDTKGQLIKVAHPVHTIYLYLYNILSVSDQGVFHLSKQIPQVLQEQAGVKFEVQWGTRTRMKRNKPIDVFLKQSQI